jgi:hypothetical protein
MRDTRDAGVLCVAEDCGAKFDGPTLTLEFADAYEWVLLRGGMALVVEIVKQSGGCVELDEASALVAGKAESVGFRFAAGGHADLHSDRMLAKTLALCPLSEQLPGLFASEFLLAIFVQSHLRILRVAHLGSRFFGLLLVSYANPRVDPKFLLDNYGSPAESSTYRGAKHPGVPALALRALPNGYHSN